MIAAAFALALAATPSATGAPADAPSGVGAPADAVTAVSAVAKTPAKKADPLPLHASAGVTTSLGSATYVLSPVNPTLQSLLTLGGTAKINEQWSVSANERIGFEWTNTDSDTYNHQLELADPRFAVSYNAFNFKDLGLGVALSGTYALPISMASRADGSLGGLGVGARGTWTAPMLKGLGAYAALSGGYTPSSGALAARYAQAQTGVGFTASNGVATSTLSCADGARAGDIENFGCGHLPPGPRWGLGLGASYQISDQLSASVDLGYAQAFSSYLPPTDGTTTGYNGTQYDNADLTGAHALNGFVPRQSTTGSLGLSWSPTAWFTLTGGTFSAQPFLSSDNKGVRFPLWDFVSPANNFSSFFVDTTFQI